MIARPTDETLAALWAKVARWYDEDTASETIERLLTHPPAHADNLEGWCRTVARSRFLNRIRAQKRAPIPVDMEHMPPVGVRPQQEVRVALREGLERASERLLNHVAEVKPMPKASLSRERKALRGE